jgi:hypothetical protein
MRADALNKIRGSAEVALLIASHQHLEIAVRVHGFECLPAINISTGAFAQFVDGRQDTPAPFRSHALLFDGEPRKVTRSKSNFYLWSARAAVRNFSALLIEYPTVKALRVQE